MNQLTSPSVAFSEWLPSGVMIHFEGGESVFFPVQFLFEHRCDQPSVSILDEDQDEGGHGFTRI